MARSTQAGATTSVRIAVPIEPELVYINLLTADERRDALVAAGVDESRIVLDPGLGFAKRAEHNWQLLARLDELHALGLPVLVGASRKRFLGSLLPEGAPVEQRDLPTAVISVLSAQAGAWAVRVHDVVATRLALDVLGAWQHGRRG